MILDGKTYIHQYHTRFSHSDAYKTAWGLLYPFITLLYDVNFVVIRLWANQTSSTTKGYAEVLMDWPSAELLRKAK